MQAPQRFRPPAAQRDRAPWRSAPRHARSAGENRRTATGGRDRRGAPGIASTASRAWQPRGSPRGGWVSGMRASRDHLATRSRPTKRAPRRTDNECGVGNSTATAAWIRGVTKITPIRARASSPEQKKDVDLHARLRSGRGGLVRQQHRAGRRGRTRHARAGAMPPDIVVRVTLHRRGGRMDRTAPSIWKRALHGLHAPARPRVRTTASHICVARRCRRGARGERGIL